MTKRPTVRHIDPVTLSEDELRSMQGPDAFPMIEDIFSIRKRSDAEPTRWFVAYVAPNSTGHGRVDEDGEARKGRVERYIERVGLQSYWPKARRPQKVPIRKRGSKQRYKTVEIVSPLLPRYVLVRMPANRTPFGLLTSEEALFNGICGLVGTAEGPSYVPDEVVTAIQRRESDGEFDRVRRRGRRTFEKVPLWAEVAGGKVRIIDGPFASYEAAIEEQIGDGRLKVSVTIFGRAVPIEVEISQILEA